MCTWTAAVGRSSIGAFLRLFAAQGSVCSVPPPIALGQPHAIPLRRSLSLAFADVWPDAPRRSTLLSEPLALVVTGTSPAFAARTATRDSTPPLLPSTRERVRRPLSSTHSHTNTHSLQLSHLSALAFSLSLSRSLPLPFLCLIFSPRSLAPPSEPPLLRVVCIALSLSLVPGGC